MPLDIERANPVRQKRVPEILRSGITLGTIMAECTAIVEQSKLAFGALLLSAKNCRPLCYYLGIIAYE